MKITKYFFIVFVSLISCSDNDNDYVPTNTFTDNRDGEIYEIVTFGDQTWFAENLRFNTMDSGSDCYDTNSTNCFIYGRYYTGQSALTSCPDGWHIPTTEEWQALFDYFGGTNAAYPFMKPYATLQGEEVGFNLLPGGWSFSNWQYKDEEGRYYTATMVGYQILKNIWLTYRMFL